MDSLGHTVAPHTPLRRSVRRAVVACCAALLAGGPAAATAVAAPTPDSPLPQALVAAVARDLKISPEQYLHRTDQAQRLGEFGATARNKFASVFGGVWMNKDGNPIVALAKGAATPAARKAAKDAGFTVVDVAHSEARLRGEKSAVDKWLGAQPAAVSANIRGTAIDTVNNTVAIRVDKIAGDLRIPSPFGSVRIITTGATAFGEPMTAQPVAGSAPAPALIGGQPYAAVADQHALRCSLGFNGTDGGGHVVNITAGHCNPNIAAVGGPNSPGIFAIHGSAIGEHLGTFTKSVLGNHDYSIVRIDAGNVPRFQNNLVSVPGGPAIAIDGIAVPVVGMPACKAGARTGFSCGTVNAVNQSVQVGDRDLNNSFSMNICALPGDSGGPVVSGRRALGISSASSVADFPVCEIPNIIGMLTGDVPQLFAQPVAGVLAENPGLKVRTN